MSVNESGVFTVYDSAASRFLDPFTAPTIEFALRAFREAVNTAGHQFNKFPADYTLFQIGSFDPDTGELQSIAPHNLGVAITLIHHDGVMGNGLKSSAAVEQVERQETYELTPRGEAVTTPPTNSELRDNA